MQSLIDNTAVSREVMNAILFHIANQNQCEPALQAPLVCDDKLGRDPDPFTGKDPTKLLGFIVACTSVFLAQTSTYSGPGTDH
jgi:hypothetical protein